jgi:predicted  nucleic acid-binding Zn-ribbon protein
MMLSALTVATTSLTSCKDYDDDINANTTEINNLKTQLATLQSALDQAKADATTAHANFATKGDLNDLKTEMAKLATADALQKAKDDLTALINGKVDQSEYNAKVKEIETEIDGIDSKLNTLGTSLNNLETAQKAADANIKLQQTALDNLQKALTEGLAAKANQSDVTALQKQIKALQDEIDALSGPSSSLSDLKKQMEDLNKKVDELGTQINVLTVFVKHALASLTFIPDYFTEGIEAALVPAYQGAYSTTSDN